jgi:hypothetical protein
LKKYASLFLVVLTVLPVSMYAEEKQEWQSKTSLVVEYGLDALERRYYHPSFRFDLPIYGGVFFAQVDFHERLNGRLQGTIDYWVDVGLRKDVTKRLGLELRLNHFCRHQTLRDTAYVWNMNEILARVVLARGPVTLALGGGGFTGGSDGYRGLLTAGGEWRGFLLPELTLAAELKLVDLSRLYHELGFSLALNPALDLFFRHVRHYELPSSSCLGLRLHAPGGGKTFLDALQVRVGASPFHRELKLEVDGEFKLEFFRNAARRVALAFAFNAPVLNGDGFFAQFWPWKMIYDIGLDYERRLAPDLFAAWVTRYRLDMPVDRERPFAASLFTGLALRNQADFDVLEKDVRFEIAAGYDFKHGLELAGKLGLEIWSNGVAQVLAEMRSQVGTDHLRLDVRLLASGGRRLEFRPYLGWKKEIGVDPAPATPGKLLFGVGFFKKL